MGKLAHRWACWGLCLVVVAAVGCSETSAGPDAGRAGSGSDAADGGVRRDATVAAPDSAALTPDAADNGWCPDESSGGAYKFSLSGNWLRPELDRSAYDGWAVVERSTDSELLLVVAQADAEADTDAGAPESDFGGHCSVTSRKPFPIIPVGSRLWLHMFVDENWGIPVRRDGWEISLRDREGGALLESVMAMRGTDSDVQTDALQFDEPMEVCSQRDRCLSDGRELLLSLNVHADVTQRLAPQEAVRVTLDQAPYELWTSARRRIGSVISSTCLHDVLDDRILLSGELRALEPKAIVSQLSRGELPACRMGNDPSMFVFESLSVRGSSAVVESEVVYRGQTDGRWLFDLVGDAGVLTLEPTLPIAEPAPGQTLWLSYVSSYFVLREAKTGPLVVASGLAGQRDEQFDLLRRWLDMPIAFEVACEYERVVRVRSDERPANYLLRARLGEAPGVIAESGTRVEFEIDGLPYSFWMSSGSSARFTLWRKPN